MMRISAAVHAVSRAMNWIAGALLIGIMGTVIADIAARSLFAATAGQVNLGFPGAVELVSEGLLLMVLFSLPHAVSRGQVIVDMFTEGWSERARNRLDGLYIMAFGLLGAAMCLQFWEEIARAQASGATTQDLQIPMFFIYAPASFATGMLTLRALLAGAERIAGGQDTR
jgi:TRAP-type C4-dicarboxylate transport system permease small subunit